MQEKGFAQILVLIGIIVVIIGGGVYFYLRKEINTNRVLHKLLLPQKTRYKAA